MKRVKHKNDMGGSWDSKTESGSVVPDLFEDLKRKKKKEGKKKEILRRAIPKTSWSNLIFRDKTRTTVFREIGTVRADSRTTQAIILTDSMNLLQKVKR